MRRLVMLAGVAAIAGAMYAAAASGSQQSKGPTAKQFNALKKQVASMNKNLKAVTKLAVAEGALLVDCSNQGAIPIAQVGDRVNGTVGYRYTTTAGLPNPSNDLLTTALDVVYPTAANVFYVMGGGSSCNTDLGGLRHRAAKAGIQVPSAHHPSFIVHRP